MSRLWQLRALRWSYAAFIAYASAETFLAPGHVGHAAIAIKLLAGSEFLAAVAFGAGLFDVAVCAVLLVIFAVAAAITIAEGEWPLRFLYYAATALFLASERNIVTSGARPDISSA